MLATFPAISHNGGGTVWSQTKSTRLLPSKQSCTLTFGDNAFHADQVTKVPAGQCARGHVLVTKTETQVLFHQHTFMVMLLTVHLSSLVIVY